MSSIASLASAAWFRLRAGHAGESGSAIDSRASQILAPFNVVDSVEEVVEFPEVGCAYTKVGGVWYQQAEKDVIYGKLFDGVNMILQLKGWGSGVTKEDWDKLFGEYTDERAKGLLWEMVARVMDAFDVSIPCAVVVQYDGDKVEDDNFARLLPVLMAALTERNFTVKAVLATKLTTAEKAPGYLRTCFEKKGGKEILERAQDTTVLHTVAFKGEQCLETNRTLRNQFGAYVNQSLPPRIPKGILMFGGGPTLGSEIEHGYGDHTHVEFANLTRKSGQVATMTLPASVQNETANATRASGEMAMTPTEMIEEWTRRKYS